MAECKCNNGIKIIYSCSGASDVGELADRAVRQLRKDGVGQGSCIAAIGAELAGYIQTAKDAELIITIDGCPAGCTQKNLEKTGVQYIAINLADMGYKKGESPYSDQLLSAAVNDIKKAFSGEIKSSKACSAIPDGCGGNC